ncbi:MAG TPA: hypothetical protein PLN31_10400 [Azoarcus taiwanensis]|nr:hypothetical protein [Azoarcus taiwanensis]
MSRVSLVFWGLVALALALIYLPALAYPLVFDDARLLDGTIFDAYGSVAAFRQRMLSYGSFVWFDTLFPEAWALQRGVNLALHAAVVVSLYFLFKCLTERVVLPEEVAGSETLASSSEAALRLGVVVFALNPVAVYAVQYLIQRSIVMATLFSVLACLGFVRGLTSGRVAWFVLAFIAYVVAVLSKEHAVMIAAMTVPLYVFVCRPHWKRVAAVMGASAVLLMAVAWVFASIYSHVLGQVFDTASRLYVQQLNTLQPGVAERIYLLSVVNQIALFFYYGFLWFVPNVTWMSVDLRPMFPLSVTSFPYWLGALTFVSLLFASVWAVLRRSDALGFAGLCLLFPLLLFATEFATVWIQDPLVLYRSYLWAIPLPGLIWLGCVSTRPKVIYVVAMVLGCVLTALAFERQLTFRSEFHLWDDAVAKVKLDAAPNAVGRWRPFQNRGAHYLGEERLAAAQSDFARAIQLGEGEGAARFSYGVVMQMSAQHDQALEAFAGAANQGFDEAGLHYHRAESLYALGRFADAMASYQQTLARTQPEEAERHTRLRLAEAAIPAREFSLARDTLEALRADRGEDVRLLTGLGMAYVGLQDSESARGIFDRILAEQPRASAYYGRAMAHLISGREGEGLADLEEAMRLEPTNPTYRALQAQIMQRR